MFKVTVYTIGKVKEPWLEAGLNEYTKRLKKVMIIDWVLLKNLEELKITNYICLDTKGKEMTSEEFSSWVIKQGSRLNLVIGGPEGIPDKIRKQASSLISLSKLTFTHQMIRLILVEQLYRAMEIDRGSSYHK